MGRDIAGLRFDNKPSVVAVNSNGTNHDVAHVSPRAIAEKAEMKDYEPDDHEEGALDVESTSHEPEEKIVGSETDNSSGHSPKTTKKSLYNSSTKPHHFHNEETYDDEDNSSSNSSTSTSSRTNKFKVTVPVAPRFTCEQRLERRKEYYTKLEEKNKAKEKEKLEYEARIKEEEQAAIKQLRKNMVYKANPIPNFYHEGPPPKAELKKIPVTRAKSPKLTRRRSCGDERSEEDTRPSERENRHSTSVYREGKNSHVATKGKNRVAMRKSNENTKVEDHPVEQENADDVES